MTKQYKKNKYKDSNDKLPISFWSTDDNIETTDGSTLKERLEKTYTKNEVDNIIDDYTDGKKQRYITKAQFKELSEAEQNDYTIVWNITDEEIDYNNLTNKPIIPTKTSELENDSNYATETYVDDKIIEASLSGGEVDLTTYAKKTDLDDYSLIGHNHDDVYVLKEEGKGLSTNDLTDELKENFSIAYRETGVVNTYHMIQWLDAHDGADEHDLWKNRAGDNSVELSNFVFDDTSGFLGHGTLVNARTTDNKNVLEILDTDLTDNHVYSITIDIKPVNKDCYLLLFCNDDFDENNPSNYFSIYYGGIFSSAYSVNYQFGTGGNMNLTAPSSGTDSKCITVVRNGASIYFCIDGEILNSGNPINIGDSTTNFSHLYIGGTPNTGYAYELESFKLYDTTIISEVDGVLIREQFDKDYESSIIRKTKKNDKIHTVIDTLFNSVNDLENKLGTTVTSIPTKTSELENDSEFVDKKFVTDRITEAQLNIEEVDLTGYALKTDLHNHDNKDVLDNITTEVKTRYDEAYTHSKATHAPANAQANVDITKAEIEAKLTGVISSHTHEFEGITNEIVTTVVSNNILALTTDRLQKTELIDGVEIILPTVTKYTEIHLYFSVDSELTIIFPKVVWDEAPDIRAGKSYELIFTTLDGSSWICDYIEYGSTVDDVQGGETDLAEYALKTELHNHNNKEVLDSFTNTLKSNYDIAYDHSQSTHAPSDAQKNSDITKAEIESKLTGDITSHTHSQYLTEHQSLDGYAKTIDIPTSLPANGGNATTVGGYSIWTGTQTQLNAITTKSDTTIYIVTE